MSEIKKYRLDKLLSLRYPELSRTKIQTLVVNGRVQVDRVVTTKVSTRVREDAVLFIHEAEELRYVSRAGHKLEKALDTFSLSVENRVCLDAGLSTGGFTDCLLQRGAQKVYGIDVGTDQVHQRIKNDERVVVMEQTNIRSVTSLPDPITFVTLDVSFISVLKVLPAVVPLLAPCADLIILIKPQFEATSKALSRGGVVKDAAVHERVKENVIAGCKALGLTLASDIITSPLQGAASGNTEFLGWFTYNKKRALE